MSIVIGIDTGGTFTDAVLFDEQKGKVLAKAKSPTTHERLEIGIEKSIGGLKPEKGNEIKKVVLSTTLATNAIVEGKGRPTALIIIGEPPKGETPADLIIRIQGKINVKGKEVVPLDEGEIATACENIKGKVEAVAIAGMMSVRNAVHELTVKENVREKCGLPVVCSHELSSKLGFTDRTVTAVLNASLIPIVQQFIASVKSSLEKYKIDAPIYMVKGDGNLAAIEYIEEKPIESILSGPAASVIGALTVAGLKDGVMLDMGGTTTDTGVVENESLALSPKGARVGEWQTLISSAEINTFGLGGDTEIIVKDGKPMLTSRRICPACRGNVGVVTPTDVLCFSDKEFELPYADVDKKLAEKAIIAQAAECELSTEEYVDAVKSMIFEMVNDKVFEVYDKNLPVVVIGAPVKAWYRIIGERTDRKIIVPEHYEVANAVGAAMASVEERVEGLVRPDEENDGFVGHIGGQCFAHKDKTIVEDFVAEQAEKLSLSAAQGQKSKDHIHVQLFREEIIERNGWRERYVETRITAVAKATRLKIL